VRSLVGDAASSKTAEDALAAARARGGHVPVVAIDGTVVHPTGRVSGGAGDAGRCWNDRAEARDSRAARGRVAAERSRHAAARGAAGAARAHDEVGAALERARNEAHQGELALVTAEKDLRRAEEQVTGFRRREDTVRGELEELTEALERANGEDEREGAARRGARALETSGRRAGGTPSSRRDFVARARARAAVGRDRAQGALARVRERAKGVRDTVERLEAFVRPSSPGASRSSTTSAHRSGRRAAEPPRPSFWRARPW
jgi:chromosome segregation protein